jgi:predicted alpha/beta-hydrolase family hydrolase
MHACVAAEEDMVERTVSIDLEHGHTTTGLLTSPEDCHPGHTPGLVLAHGANNDMSQPLLAFVAHHLANTGVAVVLRFDFPYAHRGATSPDSQPVLQDAYRRAHDALLDDPVCPPGPVFLGGKSLGARVAAELVSRRAEGEGLLAAGLVFLGFPLHAPGKKEQPRVQPLRRIDVPSLFVVGTHDPFCDLDLLRQAMATLEHPGWLYVVEAGDHSLHVPASTGLTTEDVYLRVAQEVARFLQEHTR